MPWQKSFQLKAFSDYWRVSPVQLHNGYGAVELQKNLLDKGRKKKWAEWEKYTKDAVEQDRFYVGSSQMHYALTDLLYENKDHPIHKDEIEQIRTFLKQELHRPLATLSRCIYAPLPLPDSLIHVQGSNSYLKREHLFGRNNHLYRLWDADRICAALFEEEDWGRVNRVNQWLSKQDTYLVRNNTKPNAIDDRYVCLAIGNNFLICTNASLGFNEFPALGMRIRGVREVED